MFFGTLRSHAGRFFISTGAARHSKAGVGSATSYDCPTRAAAGRRVRVTTRVFVRVEAARFECRAAPPGYRAGRPRPARPYGSQFLSLPPAYEPSTEKVRPVAHPLRLCKPRLECPAAPTGPAMQSIATRAGKCSSSETRPGSPHGGRRHPPTDRTAARKPRSAIARPSAAPRGGRNFVAAPPATGPSPKKNLARRSLSARWVYFGRPQGFHLDCALAQRAKSLLRRAGDRCRSAPESWSRLGNMLRLRSRAGPRARGGRAMLRIAITSCETPANPL